MAENKTSIVLTADDRTSAAFANVKRNLDGLKGAASSVSGALAGIGVGLSVGGFAAFVKNSIDAADNLNDLSKKTGVAVENLAGLQLVVDKSGTTMEMLGGGVAKLNKTLGEAARGSKEAQTVLRDLGITATDPMEAFYQLADAFGRFKTEGEKADAMSRVIGKTWGELAPALAEGGAGLRSMVEEGKRLNPVTKEMAEQADKFNDAMSRFKAQESGVGTAIATELLPSLNRMLEDMNEGIRIFGSFGAALVEIGLKTNPFDSVTEGLAKYRAEVKRLKDLQAGSRPEIAAMLDPQVKEAEKKLEWYKTLQRREALALNDVYGTGTYKMPGAPSPKKINITPSGSSKSAKPKDRMSDTEWAMEETAHLTRTLYQIGTEMDAAREAAFDQATQSADAWQESLDRANEKMQDAANGYKDMIDPVERYRRQLEEVRHLLDQGFLTKEQATEAEFAIQQQIDGLTQVNDKLAEQKDIAKELGLTFQSAFEDAIVGGKSFSEVLQGIASDINRMLARELITKPLGEMVTGIFKTSGGTSDQNLLGSFASLFGFASGGSFKVAGGGGTDSQLVAFKATPGEEVIVRTPQQQAGASSGRATIINMTVNAQDASSFRRSQGQIQADLAMAMAGARRFT